MVGIDGFTEFGEFRQFNGSSVRGTICLQKLVFCLGNNEFQLKGPLFRDQWHQKAYYVVHIVMGIQMYATMTAESKFAPSFMADGKMRNVDVHCFQKLSSL